MKEIPVPYIRSNQAGIVLFVVLALIFQQPLLIVALWVIQVIGLIVGLKGNLFIRLVKPLLVNFLQNAKTEAAELQKFNNTLAVAMLTCSLIGFVAGWSVAGYVFAGMVGFAAFLAICGYCVGCTIYFQYKQFKARHLKSDS